ncbi:methyltransferase domain-containing protein [Chachezhania sediminis]|uniref:methyltransferase domain-containing protein n=1 Tax=Chachezhania sediminis TaxID=2599291 RepID=UPI001E2EEA68|nr:methyltransferase domain-containing protein [Chachezhania sediminis]
MEYDEAAADRLEATYLGKDVIAQRADTLARLAIQPGEHVLDIGSGPGFLAEEMARQTGPDGRVTGVDLSPIMVARALARASCGWLDFLQADATSLPLPDAAFDVVVSTQVAEYVPDIPAMCAEIARVLKPGGRGLVMATDWGGLVWHSSDPARMDRVMKAFEPHCADPHLPRTLGPELRAAGLAVPGISYFPIVNTGIGDGSYSRGSIDFVAGYVKDGGAIPAAEVQAWRDDLHALDERGEYFFSNGRFSFAIAKP